MKFRIAAGAAVLHAASTLSVSVIAREGALLAFRFTSDDLDGVLAELAQEDERIGAAILDTDNEALIAGLTDLKREVLGLERDVCIHFQALDAVGTKQPANDDTGSHPTATGDAAISMSAPQQTSDAVDNEETEIEPQQAEPRRRRRA